MHNVGSLFFFLFIYLRILISLEIFFHSAIIYIYITAFS